MAKTVYQMRRDFGVEYKDMTPQPLRDFIYEESRKRYEGDPLGPTLKRMRQDGKSYEQIINSAARYHPDIDKFLAGFEAWLRRQ